MRAALTGLLLAVVFSGCSGTQDRAEIRAVVERFHDAVRQDRGDAACAQLSRPTAEQLESQTGQPCDDVVTRLDYEGGAIVDVHVYVTNAKVDLRGGESVFLGKDPQGWRLSAIGCRPEDGKPRDRPFECEVEA